MTDEEYQESLLQIRKEHADSIREAALTMEDYYLIDHAYAESSKYLSRVKNLIRAYEEG